MKRIVTILLAVLLVVALVACGKKNAEPSENRIDESRTEMKISEEKSKDTAQIRPVDQDADPVPQPAQNEGAAEASKADSEATAPGHDNAGEKIAADKEEPARSDNNTAAPANGTAPDADPANDPDDASEDVDVDEFTGLDSSDDAEIVIGEGQGVGGF